LADLRPKLKPMFKNKTLLIIGGTGSYGNAVLNRFLDTETIEKNAD
jgi:FlaA1/EpsC-like NDP-sugar epimerase